MSLLIKAETSITCCLWAIMQEFRGQFLPHTGSSLVVSAEHLLLGPMVLGKTAFSASAEDEDIWNANWVEYKPLSV